jgi:antirestriction protein ArdC
VDYIGAWLHVLKGDNRAVFQAASLASRAANYLLGFEAGLDLGLHKCAGPSALGQAA